MKPIFLSILWLFVFVPFFAQHYESYIDVLDGPELNLANDDIIPEIIGHDSTGYYAYTFDYGPGIAHYNRQFDLLNHSNLPEMEGLHKRNFLGLCYFNDSIYMFTSEIESKSVRLFAETINKISLEKNNDPRILMDIPNISGWESRYGFQLSRQHEKLLIYSRIDALSKHIQLVRLMMFGKDFRLEWTAEERVIYPKSPPRNSIIKVSDDGDAYFISLLDDQNLRSLWDGIRNRYHMIAVTEEGKYVNSYSLSIPDLYIRGVQIEPGENHLLSCAGFYSPTHFRGRIDGIFYFELDNRTGEFLNETLHEFEPWVLGEAIAEKRVLNPRELFEFRVRQLIRRDNGNFIMLAENEYDHSFDTYQNIIAACISPGGMLQWTRVIQKRQSKSDGEIFNYCSYGVHAPKNTDDVTLVFNDHASNESLESGKRPKSFYYNGLSNLKVVDLGPHGEITESYVYRKSTKSMKTPLPLLSYDKLNNQMVIPALWMKEYRYMELTFGE